MIAIDGPAATGKSTTAKIVAKKLGYTYLDTGAMYRCVTLAFLNDKVNLDDAQLIQKILDEIEIQFEENEGEVIVLMNNVDVSNEIRSLDVTKNVSAVSALESVRNAMVKIQRKIALKTDCVMEGRDIGTVVFPDADVKIFLIGDIEVRAKRRQLDLESLGEEKTIQELVNDIEKRDQYDSLREISPLRKAEDAVEVDTSQMTIDDQVSRIIEIVNQKQ